MTQDSKLLPGGLDLEYPRLTDHGFDGTFDFFAWAGDGSIIKPKGLDHAGKRESILFVTDDGVHVESLRKMLPEGDSPAITLAPNASSALGSLRAERYALVIVDCSERRDHPRMSAGTAVGLITQIKKAEPSIEIIVILDRSQLEAGLAMMKAGVFDCVLTPFASEQLLSCVERGLERRRDIIGQRAYYELIERTMYRRTRDLNAMLCELEESYRQTLWALGSALESRDVETNAHSMRVMKYARVLAEAMGFREQALRDIEYGVFLHDIGKIGVPDAILLKPGKLTEEEWAAMKEHPGRGRYLLAGIKFLQGGLDIVYCHHERWDGRGYPRGLREEAIPFGARIFAVGDTLDAMTSDRPYRKALPYQRARAEILANSGTQFDPSVVEVFRAFGDDDWKRLREEADDLARSIVQRKRECLKD